MIDSLAENLKVKFNEICSHATNIRIVETPFSVEVSNGSEKLQLEFSYESILRSSSKQEILIAIYDSLPLSQHSELRKLARNLVIMFSSIHMCI
jgi:hypothetical protein